MQHKHNTTSNTDEVYRTFIGCKVEGLVRETTFDGHYADILVFECGWGLAFNSNGSHWVVRPGDVSRFIQAARKDLEDAKRELGDIPKLAGE